MSCIRYHQKSDPLLKGQRRLYNVHHIADSEAIELQKRLASTTHPPPLPPQPGTEQAAAAAPASVDCKTVCVVKTNGLEGSNILG